MSRRAGAALLLAAVLVSLLSLAACHDDAAAAGAPAFTMDDSDELAAEAHAALLHQTVRPYDPNIRVAAAASRDLLDLQASDPESWASNIGDGDEGPGEDQSDLPGSGINFNLKQVIYDGTSDNEPSSTNEAGQRWANEEAGPVDTGAVAADETAGDAAGDAAGDVAGDAAGDDGGDGPEPVERGFEAGAVEPLPDAPDFVPMWMRKAGQDDQPNVDEEPKLHEIAAALKAGASSTQQARQQLGQQQEQEQQGQQEPQVGDVVGEDEPDLPIASRRLLSDPDEVTDDGTDDATGDATGDSAGHDAETPSPAEEGAAGAAGNGDAQTTDDSGEAVVAMEDDAAPAEAWTRKLMQSGNPGGSNQPGLFTTGDNPLQHTAGIASDNPSGTPPIQPPAGTPSSVDNTAGINPNVLRSFNNDLVFAIKSSPSSSRRRRLLDDSESGDTAVTGDTTDDTAGDATEVQELTQQDFLLPVAEHERAISERAELISALEANMGPTEDANVEIDPAVAEAAYDAAVAAVKAMGLYETLRGEQEAAPVEDVPAGHWDQGRQLGEASAALNRKLVSGVAAQDASILPSTWPHVGEATLDDKPLYGVSYSWRRAAECDGVKRVCQCPHPDAFDKDMEILHRYSRRFRTYSVECPDIMRMMAHLSTADPSSLSWMLGVWVGKDEKANQAQLTALERILTEYPNANYYAIAVGNEVMHRRDLTQEAHIAIIRQVRVLVKKIAKAQGSSKLAAVPITTVDVPWAITAELAAELDVVAINVHPFYSGLLDTTQKGWIKTAVGGALYHVSQLRKQFKNKPVLVAEVGWPTASGAADTNVGSIANAKAFVQAWVKAAKQFDVPYFYHEAFDAAWKGKLRKADASVVADEHFGLVSADRTTDRQLLL